MGLARRATYGALGGVGGTVALSGLRQGLARVGLVQKTAPEQVVDRLRELGIADGLSPEARRALTIAVHLGYGVGMGVFLGVLRRKRARAVDEAAVGAALGLLAWGAGWTTVLPLAGVHEPPWEQESAKILLPVLDHAVFGVVWALVHRSRGPDGV